MTTLLCAVSGPLDAVRAVVATAGAEFPCRPVAVSTGARDERDAGARHVSVRALLTSESIDRARGSRADVVIDVLQDVDAAGAAARGQVSTRNRYAARGALPRGVGRKE